MFSRARPGSTREAQHEIGRVEQEQDQEEHELAPPQPHQTPHEIFAQIEPVTSVSAPKIVALVDRDVALEIGARSRFHSRRSAFHAPQPKHAYAVRATGTWK